MQVYAMLAADGMTPEWVGSGPVIPEGAVLIGEGSNLEEIGSRCLVSGAWVDRQAIADPVESQSILGHRLIFTGLPAGTVVMVQDVSAALAIVVAEVNDGTADILLASVGTYDVEITPPAPARRWERRVQWS